METSHESVNSLKESISDDNAAVDIANISKWEEGADMS
jgi:hypothetical protein